jgi:hypothetical protein
MQKFDQEEAIKEMERMYLNLTKRVTELPNRYLEEKVVYDSMKRITKEYENPDPASRIKILLECSFVLGYVQGIRDKE